MLQQQEKRVNVTMVEKRITAKGNRNKPTAEDISPAIYI